jgi:hypothetical protein
VKKLHLSQEMERRSVQSGSTKTDLVKGCGLPIEEGRPRVFHLRFPDLLSRGQMAEKEEEQADKDALH